NADREDSDHRTSLRRSVMRGFARPNALAVRPDAAGGRSEPAKGLASSTYSTGMACDVLAQHTIHAGLPAFTGGLEIGKDFPDITHRYELLCAPRLGTTAQCPKRNHGLELLGRERSCIRIRFGRGGNCLVFFRSRHGNRRPFRYFGHSVSPRDDWRGAN